MPEINHLWKELSNHIQGLARNIWIKTAGKILLALLAVFFVTHIFFPLRDQIQYSTIAVDSDGKMLHAFLSPDDKWRMFTELDEISPELSQAIIFKEDKYFNYHFGINPFAIVRAMINNTVSGRRTSGASTITMQVARMLEPKPRTLPNKLIEMFRALQLEWRYSKKEILQLYLNLVPYGGNIEGVKSASILYFDKFPNHLSLAEITALSIIPNRPTSLRLGPNNSTVKAERNKWLERFQQAGLFDAETIQDALLEPLTAQRLEAPKEAPHLAIRLKSEYPNTPIIRSTLKWDMQKKAEKLALNHINRLYHRNIKNAAALIIENETKQVLAYVGSSDFADVQASGQMDGVRAVRSPGSTLKPLLYGMAFDMGITTPKRMISDVPINYSGYEPENYDEKFRGNVTIEFALANSLNVPAVKVLDEISAQAMVDKLKDCDFVQIGKDEKKLGLSLALGGCGVSLEEMTALYSSFATNGYYKETKWIEESKDNNDSTFLLSAKANFMLTEILLQLQRPDLPLQWQNSANLPKVAWKTGTSYGRRDAWSIGYNKKYTIGVWVGNFSGEGVPELNGAATASPLLFQLFNAIDPAANKEWFSSPEELNFRTVCSQSGHVPSDFCESTTIDYFIPTKSSNKKCDHLKKVFVNIDSTYSYCTSCIPANGYAEAYYPNHAPEILTHLKQANVNFLEIPKHNPNCERVFVAQAPRITSPVNSFGIFCRSDR